MHFLRSQLHDIKFAVDDEDDRVLWFKLSFSWPSFDLDADIWRIRIELIHWIFDILDFHLQLISKDPSLTPINNN